MKRWLTIALSGLVLSCQGPAAVLAQGAAAHAAHERPGQIERTLERRPSVRNERFEA